MEKLIRIFLIFSLLATVAATQPGAASISSAADGVVTFESGKYPGREIHVSPHGDDDSGDGSAGNPYQSVGRAAQAATPGTAIRIHAGTYTGRAYIENLAGTSAAPIWIGGAPGEAKPVFRDDSEGLHLSRVRYVVLHDIEVTQTSDNGINTDDGGDYANAEATRYIVFRGLYVHDVGSGGNEDCLKLSGVNDYWVLDSEFARCGGGGSGSGIDHVGCHHGLIVGNFFHELSANAVQSKGGSEDIEIRANHMVDSGERSVNIGGSTGFEYFRPPLSTTRPNFEARNIRVLANVIEGSIAPLAFVGAVDSLAANNTIINPDHWLLRILQETTTEGSYEFLACSNNRVINNIFYFNRGALSTYINIGPNTTPESFSFANNLWYAADDPGQSQPDLPVTESDGIIGQNPLFAGLTGGNFQVQTGSPAIGGGIALPEVTNDYNGLVYNAPPSVGAFEANPLNLNQRFYLPLVTR